MKKNTLLIIGGVIVAYYLWKKSQETTDTVIVEEGEMSNVAGHYVGGVVCSKNGRVTGCVASCGDGSTQIDTCLRYKYGAKR